MSSPFDEWFGRRRRFGSWFPDVDDMMRDVEKMMQEAFKNVEQQIPKNLVKERKLDDGSIVREMGPIVYGYSVKVGPDGKPVVRKFGNIDAVPKDRKSTRLNSSHANISYAVFCLKKKHQKSEMQASTNQPPTTPHI